MDMSFHIVYVTDTNMSLSSVCLGFVLNCHTPFLPQNFSVTENCIIHNVFATFTISMV